MTSRRRRRPTGGPQGRPDPPDPRGEGWWCDERTTPAGTARVFVLAAGPEEARAKVEELLCDLGALPGGSPDLHDSFLRMCDFARGRGDGLR